MFHPFEHLKVSTIPAVRLAANEAVVVYRRQSVAQLVGPTSAEAADAPVTLAAPAPAAGRAPIPASKFFTEKGGKSSGNGSGESGSGGSGGGGSSEESSFQAAPRAEPATSGAALLAEVAAVGAVHVDRRVVHGPAVFMPGSDEWLHEFSWHGSIKDGKGSKTGYSGDVKVPHALNFTTLRCMPEQMYYSVRDVRTLDDANLTV